MKPPRFVFVLGAGSGSEAHPAWPDVHYSFAGEVDEDGAWVAWRLTGANHRELGRSARVFPNLERAQLDATALHERVAEAQPQILTIPHTVTWGWRLRMDDVVVATSSRGYARQRECAYNLSAFATAATVAELADRSPARAWQLTADLPSGPRRD